MIKSFTVIANILFVFGIILLLGSLVSLYKVQKFRSAAIKAEGTVISITRGLALNTHSSNYSNPLPYDENSRNIPAFHRSVYSFIVSYIDANGIEQRYHSGYSELPPSYFIGDKVTVYYNKHEVQLGGWGILLPTLLTGGGGLFLIIFRIIYYFIKKHK